MARKTRGHDYEQSNNEARARRRRRRHDRSRRGHTFVVRPDAVEHGGRESSGSICGDRCAQSQSRPIWQQWRDRNNGAFRHNGAGAGVALGVLGAAGALAAGSAYRQNLYGPGYYQQGYGGGYGYGYGGYANGPANYGYYNSPNYGYYNNH